MRSGVTALDGVDTGGLAVPFSGGVDSALLAASLDARCTRSGSPTAPTSRRHTRVLGREVRTVEFGHDRLARQAGYKRRMDDHVSQYVESLL